MSGGMCDRLLLLLLQSVELPGLIVQRRFAGPAASEWTLSVPCAGMSAESVRVFHKRRLRMVMLHDRCPIIGVAGMIPF